MLIKTILNKIEKFKSFIYGKITLERMNGADSLIVEVKPRQNAKGTCPKCRKRKPTYDTQPVRFFEYVPLWGIPVYFCLKHLLLEVCSSSDGLSAGRSIGRSPALG